MYQAVSQANDVGPGNSRITVARIRGKSGRSFANNLQQSDQRLVQETISVKISASSTFDETNGFHSVV